MDLKTLAGCLVAAGVLVACGGGSVPDEGGPTVRMESDPGDQALDEWAAEAESQEEPQVDPLTDQEMLQLKLNQAAEINQRSLAAAKTAQASANVSESRSVVRPKLVTRVPVYRFWNSTTKAHFYTTNEAERDRVRDTLPMFRYEGVAFHVSSTDDADLSPVYRYFNSASGVHFYTISPEEKAYVDAELPQMRYEGVAYYASRVAGAGLSPLYRFFHGKGSFHFYSASAGERNSVNANLCDYRYEGVGYYVLEEPPVTPPADPEPNQVMLVVGDSLSEKYVPGMNMRRYRFVSPGRIWADQLEASLGSRTGRVCDRMVNVSVGGRRTRDGLAGLPNWLALYKPTHVLIAQGTNDAWGSVPLATIEANLNQMVSLARNAGAKPYVMEFPFLRSGNSYRQNLSAVYRRAGSTAQASYIFGTNGVAQNATNYHPDLVHLTNTPQPRIVNNAWAVMAPDFQLD
jgi:lysophospholipase L1-like esterase